MIRTMILCGIGALINVPFLHRTMNAISFGFCIGAAAGVVMYELGRRSADAD